MESIVKMVVHGLNPARADNRNIDDDEMRQGKRREV
jgi:hypothetical protein